MWDSTEVKNILCIRPDNMGDLVMSGPAIRALKAGLDARITVLTSSMASAVAPTLPGVDEVITFDMPWVKTNNTSGSAQLTELIELLDSRRFDAAVIFTVFSQNPMPTAMIAYQAGIPRILAYCRENPYGLISDWVVDEEPYKYIRHQVERDLQLVYNVCPAIGDTRLRVNADKTLWPGINDALTKSGLDPSQPWVILHAGVSELKRQLPTHLWVQSAKGLIAEGYQVVLTGSPSERDLIADLQAKTGKGTVNTAGCFTIPQLITLISEAPLLLTVNTGTVHLAAAVGTPVVVLYAQTNPQHTPWAVPNKVIEFPVEEGLKSKNQVLQFVNDTVYSTPAQMPTARQIVDAALSLLRPPAASGQPFRGIPSESPANAASL